MPEQNVNAVPITESSSRPRHPYAMAALVLTLATAGISLFLTNRDLLPLQRFYLLKYGLAATHLRPTGKFTFAEVVDHAQLTLAVPQDVADDNNHLVLSQAAASRGRGPLYFTPRIVTTDYFYDLLRTYVYQGQSPADLLDPTAHLSLTALLLFGFAGIFLDWSNNRKRRIGIIRRGPSLLDRDQFNRALHSDGIGFEVKGLPSLRELFLAPPWRRGHTRQSGLSQLLAPLRGRGIIRIPRKKECSHQLLVGATGTGKSQLLVQLINEIQHRGEVAIIYDPDGEFLAQFYDEARGDIILNPLDTRCPYWSPSEELAANEEALTLAESLFPEPHNADDKNTFFIRAPRQILARLFEYKPTPQELVGWLTTQGEIDKRLKGTEMEEMLAKSAGPQRAGILAALGMALNAFRLLREEEECATRWTAREWSKTRKGWIFITSTETTRTVQLPLISMWLDTILLRLMTKPPTGTTTTPVWLLIDELASLRRLPSLQPALTRARKYQIKIVIGFQGQSQMQELYGREAAETIMGMPATTVFFRTKEPQAADWVSRSIGEQEVAREKLTYSLQTGLTGKKTRNYAIEIKSERAVTASQIEGLPDLTGYIKVENSITHFRLPIVPRLPQVPAFIPRNTTGFAALTLPEPYTIIDTLTPSDPPQPDSTLPAQPAAPPKIFTAGGTLANTPAQTLPGDDDAADLPFESHRHTLPVPALTAGALDSSLTTNYHDSATASLLTADASSTANPIRQAVELAEVLTALAITTQSPTANAPDPEEQHAPDITDDVFLA
jgi:hypothetical protein